MEPSSNSSSKRRSSLPKTPQQPPHQRSIVSFFTPRSLSSSPFPSSSASSPPALPSPSLPSSQTKKPLLLVASSSSSPAPASLRPTKSLAKKKKKKKKKKKSVGEGEHAEEEEEEEEEEEREENGENEATATPSRQTKEPLVVGASSLSSARRQKRLSTSQQRIGGGEEGNEGMETPGKHGFSDPMALIGKKLRVYWPLDDAWYNGCVKGYEDPPFHRILYDDGEEESLCLQKEKIEWLPSSAKKVESRRKLRRLSFINKSFVTDKEKDSLSASESDEEFSGAKRTRKIPRKSNGGEKNICNGDDEMEDKDVITQEQAEDTVLCSKDRKEHKKYCDDVQMEDTGSLHDDKKNGKRLQNNRMEGMNGKDDGISSESGDNDDDDSDDDDAEWIANDEASSEEDVEEEMEEEEEVAEASDVDDDAIVSRPTKSRRKTKKHRFSSQKSTNLRPTQNAQNSSAKILTQNVTGSSSVAKRTTSEQSAPRGTAYDCSIAEPIDKMQEQGGEGCSGLAGDVTVRLVGEASERFAHRTAEKFKFLENRKDASGRRPSDPEYDPRTVYLPADFLKGLSGCQKQWWEFKSKNMDKVLLFKMGKFYELFEMDAHVGAQHLDLQYMKGDQPHCGFPEKNFEENAGKLARLGFRILVVEQVETPEQREQRNMKLGTKDKVVKRDICAVITKGTITDGEMLISAPDAAYLMTIYEILDKESSDATTIGLCFLDAATSRFIIGQLVDDEARSRLRLILSELRPVELVQPRGLLSGETERALKEQTRNALVTKLTPGLEFWDSERTIHETISFFKENTKGTNKNSDDRIQSINEGSGSVVLPDFLRSLFDASHDGEAAICALGGCIFYLKQALLDQRLLNSGRFELLPGSDKFLEILTGDNTCFSTGDLFADKSEPFMLLDSSALENLEILENNHNGGISGTLLAQLDHCVTAFGRRLLKQWIVRPLLRPDSIQDRQHAIEDIKGIAADGVSQFRKDLLKLPDMERLVVRLKACNEKSGRNALGVVLYEDAAKKLLKEFLGALNGFQKITQILSSFSSISSQFQSQRLRALLSSGEGMPNIAPALKYFEDAFDWSDAEKTGRITPHEGVDSDFDVGSVNIITIKRKLEAYLKEQQEYFKNQSVTFVTVGKDRYQLEIPESVQKKVPSDYEVMSSRKGFKRYLTQPVKELVQELAAEEDRKEAALRNILHGLLARFCENYASWLFIVRLIAELDALISLSIASSCILGMTCKPIISCNSRKSAPLIVAKGLRHPILENSLEGGQCFVPNDINLGGENHASFMLLTGPNMGGKSTLLRQVCLAVILAQVGADVPASEFHFSPVDRVFVRMGARDHIMSAQSTFLVELLETASMLTCATKNSLVALDELGRGTATSDGQAIAHAVLEHLANNARCLGLFSTHYHRLAADHANDPLIALYHMGCKVETKDGMEKVTFLYRLVDGPCPKSYGVNVARIAGMPERILKRAITKSAEIEQLENTRVLKHYEEKLFLEASKLAKKLFTCNQQDLAPFHNILEEWRRMHPLLPAK